MPQSINMEIFLSAFLGFLSALLVQFLTARGGSAQRRRALLVRLRKEVGGCLSALASRSAAGDTAFVGGYSVAVWRSALATGHFSDLRPHELEQFSGFYRLLEELQDWEKSSTEFYLRTVVVHSDDPAVAECQEQLQSFIVSLYEEGKRTAEVILNKKGDNHGQTK